MMVLITYDVNTTDRAGRRRLHRVAKACDGIGQRVQQSVFECVVDSAQFAEFKQRLCQIIDDEKDSLRFYFLGAKWQRRVEHVGAKPSFDPEGILIT